MVGVSLRTSGLAEIRSILGSAGANVHKAAEQGMYELVEIGELEAKQAILDKDLLFRRALLNSIESIVTTSAAGVQGEVFSELVYAYVMEEGRRPGASPPPSAALIPWVKQKIGGSPAEINGLAFVISRSIGLKGIEARKFMARAYARMDAAALPVFERVVGEFARRAVA